MKEPKQITLPQLRKALLDVSRPLSPSYLYRFSDLTESDLEEIKTFWGEIPVWRKQALFEDLEEMAENDTLVSFDAISSFALGDDDPRVRELAIRNLWESELPELIPVFINMLNNDPDKSVRAAAASALGRFVFLGEIDAISPKRLEEIENQLIAAYKGHNALIVRQRALEALGYSSREEVVDFLREAYYSGNQDLMLSSIFAMGRSANKDWIPFIQPLLSDENPAVRFEAARAAGELEAGSCRERLIELVDDSDYDVKMAAIWSLSQIGGEGVKETLVRLYDETDDDDILYLVEDALDNLAFTESSGFFTILDISELEDDDSDVGIFDDDFDFDTLDDED
jgi:HEAT repeat protein